MFRPIALRLVGRMLAHTNARCFRYLALVCLIRADNFDHKDGIIDYNISRFKETLAKVFERPPLRLVSA